MGEAQDRTARTASACIACRAMKRKCVMAEGKTKCDRCIAKGITKCQPAPGRPSNKRKDFAYGRSCKRCHSLKRSCSASDTTIYPCTLCAQQNLPCEVRQTVKAKKQRDDAEPYIATLRLSLAMNATYESLAGLDSGSLPDIFGLDFPADHDWALFFLPRNISPHSINFLHEARIVNCHVGKSFTEDDALAMLNQKLYDLKPRDEQQYKQLLPHMVNAPGEPKITHMLEIIHVIGGRLCSVHITHLHDITGVTRLLFMRVVVIDELDFLNPVEKLTAQANLTAIPMANDVPSFLFNSSTPYTIPPSQSDNSKQPTESQSNISGDWHTISIANINLILGNKLNSMDQAIMSDCGNLRL
ncbi:hypothetical protein SARC_07874 [Sphaeroforma arctica JP610]|uniref:Zn(2)-C6 fungal-type domain-containing protein n=1 Tax=Sphaeroforma arctica JP610 TaxID=667725 RepID=A0A0L0FSI6_9EUKA|nr:hypothetical protein SARC_07874 [Sphaeroforma arctica JP610]KNC79735.1 hypothetical protein SARC_07874 [Sphaeroforma arctica JP610]|eukprot:XP_014153637.1 hypothetical protein SARC_07874 [Sphaeroforma arctica JP610]